MLAVQKPERSFPQVLSPQCRLQLQRDPRGVNTVQDGGSSLPHIGCREQGWLHEDFGSCASELGWRSRRSAGLRRNLPQVELLFACAASQHGCRLGPVQHGNDRQRPGLQPSPSMAPPAAAAPALPCAVQARAHADPHAKVFKVCQLSA